MNNIKLGRGERALVVVAHPDDETIWMGGVLLSNPEVRWTIFSLSRASDKDRAPKFRKVCKLYGAECIFTDLDDEGQLGGIEATRAAEACLRDGLAGKEFDCLFTHGENGEYGHPLHIITHKAVNNVLKKSFLNVKKVFYFDYRKKENNIISGKNPDFIVDLSKDEFFEKKRIVSEMYGYPIDGIDVGYCNNQELFKLLKK
ncbi:hypothetical protein DRH27_03820 [Candidatus Falkowbacteria bacterium]|nr:MAG: hypothetical protein DRH27_03820 [Candidatus Falkowbacteria bacterium]